MGKGLILCLSILVLASCLVEAGDVGVRQAGDVVEICVKQVVVLRVRRAHGGFSPLERGRIVAGRLAGALAEGLSPEQIAPDIIAGQHVVAIGGRLIITVDQEHADINRCQPWELALIWANNLRQALGAAPISSATPALAVGERSYIGVASWYGGRFHGRRTASGEVFDQNGLSAAHRSWPFGLRVRVTNLQNGESVVVKINDRGPYVQGRAIDLSRAAARAIGLVERGIGLVKMEWLDGGDRLLAGR
ncbi:MAG: septal ring lytic transglycosylase RlpA family protein [Limnochordia bacterium]|jgi:rare lipoprotein A